jgi:hypothetical protein
MRPSIEVTQPFTHKFFLDQVREIRCDIKQTGRAVRSSDVGRRVYCFIGPGGMRGKLESVSTTHVRVRFKDGSVIKCLHSLCVIEQTVKK